MELVGSYLGLAQDQGLYDYFRRHYAHFFPALARLHRTTFVRQASNLWAIKERLWCLLRDRRLMFDPTIGFVDSLPVPACRFARALWCVCFDGIVSYRKDHADRQTFYGFRLHLRLSWQGVIPHAFLAPANEADGEMVWQVTQGTTGLLLGDHNYWLPQVQADLRSQGIVLQAPYRRAQSRHPQQPTIAVSWGGFALSSIPSLGS